MSDPLLDPVRLWTPDDLLTALGGVEELIRFYDLTTRDDLQALKGVMSAAMESAHVSADLQTISAAIGEIRSALAPAPTQPDADLIRWGARIFSAGPVTAEEVAAFVNCQIVDFHDQLLAVVSLASGIYPTGEYFARRLVRCA